MKHNQEQIKNYGGWTKCRIWDPHCWQDVSVAELSNEIGNCTIGQALCCIHEWLDEWLH